MGHLLHYVNGMVILSFNRNICYNRYRHFFVMGSDTPHDVTGMVILSFNRNFCCNRYRQFFVMGSYTHCVHVT